MRERGLLVGAAFLLAVLATAAVFLYVNNVRKEAKTGGELVGVIVSQQGIPAGTDLDPLIDAGAFREIQVPSDAVVSGAVTSLSQLQGGITREAILANEQIASARLVGSEQLPGGALGIPKGMQAITLALELAPAVGDEVQQGDHVTVFASGSFTTIKRGQELSETGSDTVVPSALVLKVVDPDPSDSDAGKTLLVTLALTPRDGESVLGSQVSNEVWLGLLPPGEAAVSPAATPTPTTSPTT
ncbi:MAG: RcpC/CpaB family pilus assembly protein [Actinomycetota bacterium]